MITGVIVSYNQKDLLKQCVESIRSIYPEMPLVIIDGSQRKSPCYEYAKTLNDVHTIAKCVEYNIGHGNGMKLGIGISKTRFVALIDSDTILKAPVLESMISMFEKNTFGVGRVIKVNDAGINNDDGLDYLHPYFCVIDKNAYLTHDPIIHHGAPFIVTMKSIKQKGRYHLKNFDLEGRVLHLERGTRALNPKEFHPKLWAKVPE